MNQHFHIITCDSVNTMGEFHSNGWVGVRPILSSDNIPLAVRLNWDIIADLARVQKGDYVILHSQGYLRGVYEALNAFQLDSQDADLFTGVGLTKQSWQSKQSDPRLQNPEYRWWLRIGQAGDMTFPIPAPIDTLFAMIAKGEVKTLPQRLRYEDKNKTVKGLHKYDFAKVLDVLLGFNPQGNVAYSPTYTTPFPNSGQNLNYVLTPDNYEKNLEACLVHAIRTDAPIVTNCIGEARNVLNTLPIGYLGMADIVSWSDLDWPDGCEHLWNITVWELKTDNLNEGLVESVIPQVIKYLRNVRVVFPSSVSHATPLHGVIVARLPHRGTIGTTLIQNVLPKHQSYRFSVVGYRPDSSGQLNLSLVCTQESD